MLTGKVIIITGASSGIGLALARQAVEENAYVVIAARRKDRLDALVSSLGPEAERVLPVGCDVSRREEAEGLVSQAIKRFGRIDVLVNNAGRGHVGSIEDTSDEVLASVFGINTFALWYTTRPVLGLMKKQGSGHIINVASMAGRIGFPYNSAYVAAKFACVGFTEALRLELLDTGVTASVICPAGVLTDWAASTEGGSMLPLFSEAGKEIKRIAREQGLPLPPIDGVITADAVARAIIDCIHTPVAVVYTQGGARDFVVLSAKRREDAEQFQKAVVLGERSVYERLRAEGKILAGRNR